MRKLILIRVFILSLSLISVPFWWTSFTLSEISDNYIFNDYPVLSVSEIDDNVNSITINPHGKEEGVIITSYFSYRGDPRQVNKTRMRPNFEHIYNFYWPIVHNGLHTIIFHDEFSFDDAFVQKWSHSPSIKFVKLDSKPHWYESNPLDLRFDLYNEQLPKFREKYKWFIISDLDMIFNRNPFTVLEKYERKDGKTFFGSYDSKTWLKGASGYQMNNCFGTLTSTFTKKEWSTPNGCAGLWAGQYEPVKCVLDCMAQVHSKSPVKDVLIEMPCDMAVFDYCVHYGGCFGGQMTGKYHQVDDTVLWGKDTMGPGHNFFGPPVVLTAEPTACIKDSWTVSHLRCGKKQKWPICYDHSSINIGGNNTKNVQLRKYFQIGYPGWKNRCKLDDVTHTPLPSTNLSERAIGRHHTIQKYLKQTLPCFKDSSC